MPRPLQKLLRLPDWLALLVVLLIDRVLIYTLVQAMAGFMDLPPRLLGWAAVVHGLPGLALMLAVLPWIIPPLRVKKERIARRHDQE